MLRRIVLFGLLIAGPAAWAFSQTPTEDKPAEAPTTRALPRNDVPARKPFLAAVVDDPAATIEANMKAQWSTPQRKKWRIDYRPITGMTSRSSWHIAGTHWWVRLYPDYYKLDDLDKQSTYEIDAVALNQNYGVIDFYIYGRPQMAAK